MARYDDSGCGPLILIPLGVVLFYSSDISSRTKTEVTILVVVGGILLFLLLWLLYFLSGKFKEIRKKLKRCPHGVRGAEQLEGRCSTCDISRRKEAEEIDAGISERNRLRTAQKIAKFRSFREKVLQDEYLHQMDPVDFEKLICLLFERMGYRTELTPRTGDNGVDAFIFKDGKKLVLQCKRAKGGVGEPVLRDLYGSMISAGATWAYLATTGRVSNQARDWIVNKPIQLIEIPNIKKLIKEYLPDDDLIPSNFRPTMSQSTHCPRCGGRLRAVNGKRGPFVGCSNYPNCKYTRDANFKNLWE